MGHYPTLFLGIISVIKQTHGMGKRRLQTRITHTDIQRIGIIDNRQQVFHTRLTTTPTISDTQLTYLREAITKIQIRSKIEYRSCGISHVISLLIQTF